MSICVGSVELLPHRLSWAHDSKLPTRHDDSSAWIQRILATENTTRKTTPQKVVFWKGNPRRFQGNPGWWNIIIWPEEILPPTFRCVIFPGSCVKWCGFPHPRWKNPGSRQYCWVERFFLAKKPGSQTHTVDGRNPAPPGMYETL